MSCQEFVSNLTELNNGENGYSSDELKRLYEAFKQEPLRWPVVEVPTFNLMYGAPSVGQVTPMLPTGVYGFPGMNGGGPAPNGVSFGVSPAGAGNSTSPTSPTPNAIGSQAVLGQTPYWQATAADPALLAAWTAAASGNVSGGGIRPTAFNPQQQTSGSNGTNATDGGNSGDGGDLLKLFTNPFADMPKDISAKEYMRGFVMRKCVMESRGKRTAMGKRSWKLFYARLRDLTLYLYRDAETAATATRAEEMALGYMKQVYRFQLHCQHLRFYYQHHEQQQQRLMQQQQQQIESTTNGEEGTPSSENHTSSTSSGSTITVKVDPTISSTVVADETENGDTEVEGKPPRIVDTPQTNGTANPPPGPTMPSVLEQQLAAAAFQLPPPPPPPPPPEGVICIAHALASVADDYSKKPNVFRLRTKDGSEYLMQVNDPKELEYWVDKINYVAGLLSAPSLPSAVGSDQTFHRPILPAGVTHLGVHEQLEGHQKRILDLTRDLTELKRRRMSAPSQPNLTYLSRDSITPSPAPSIRSESLASVVSNENETSQQLQQPPSSTLPYIPDSVLKSLQPSSAATLPSSATQHPERSISSAFSTASLGRRRKKSFNALRGGSGSDLAAQRAELDERVAFLEHELTRYKTYSRLLEAELTRLQRMPPQTPASPQTPYGTPGPIRGFWQVCGPSADLQEEPSEGCIGGAASPIVSSLPPPPSSKRGYSPSGMRQTRFQRMQYRQYQMQQRRQQQQLLPTPTPILSASGLSPSNPPVPNVQKAYTEEETTLSSPLTEENKKPETMPTAFYEVI
ncbi:unnamed protein product [Hymenolepis diminuta]|uniref:PH domain-containing protein n=1 Tax=Hymenolepis diminuta TaxID=6216 RepID=A0A564YAF7_HYMDI|nr:unnamed protein product [Hymenolepis diminuta]